MPERVALARELRSTGRREEATAVAALRKPSIAAWGVNQLVRAHDRPVADLFQAGDELRDAQSGVLAGQAEAGALRRATEQERAAVEDLIAKARALLSSEGHELSPVILERVAETLHAAALDEDARTLVSEGRLQRELRHVGLGAGIGAQSPLTPGKSPHAEERPSTSSRQAGRSGGAKEHADAAKERADAEKERADAAKLAARQRAQARKAAQAGEAQARRRADRAARTLRAAEQRHTQAAEALQRAEEQLAQAHTDAQAAADAHRDAKQRLEAL